ncbi:MAG: hypothetical protein PVF15_03325 [Candidatus Bathyarchaeota archaeon]|jgi:hypothetical protein
MIGFIPDIVQIALPLAVGLVAIRLHRRTGRFGLKLISVVFFLSAVPSMVRIGLGGPYLAFRLMDLGFTAYQYGLFQLFLWILNATFQAVFAVLTVIGLVKLKCAHRLFV